MHFVSSADKVCFKQSAYVSSVPRLIKNVVKQPFKECCENANDSMALTNVVWSEVHGRCSSDTFIISSLHLYCVPMLDIMR